MVERELKAVVADPDGVKARLAAAGAEVLFQGQMADRRFDRAGELAGRDEVLRVREYRGIDGSVSVQVAWKGPTTLEAGYKIRDEHEFEVVGAEGLASVIAALGYRPVHAIDRYVECYRVAEVVVRLEWYPRMDVLVEVEGAAGAIEQAVAVIGEDRAAYGADALAAFVGRYETRTGRRAAVSLAELGSERPSWEALP